MKLYYDNNILNEIEYQLDCGNPSRALELADEYLIDYPSDVLGPLYKARTLIELGRADEIGEIVDESTLLCTHDVKSAINGYTQLGHIYAACDDQEKAINSYFKAIELEDDSNDYLSLKARAGLVNLYVNNKELEKALELINETQSKSDDTFITKKAYIYFLQGKYEEALELLSTVRDDNNNFNTQFRNYLYGRLYFALSKFEIAKDYFKKCFTIKNLFYYKAVYYLSGIYTATNHLEKALNYAKQLENFPDLKDQEVRAKFRIYLKMGYLGKAKKLMKKPKNELYKNYLMAKYYYSIKEYDKTIEYASHVLDQADSKLFDIAGQMYIMSYMKKGEFEYAKSLIPYFYQDIDKLTVNQILAYISAKLDAGDVPDVKMYNCQQLVQYNEEKAIQHVLDHHLNNFKSEEFVRELFDNKNELMKGQRCISDNIFDKYIIPYRGVGYDDEGTCNTLVIITIPDTKDIITLYPLSGCEVYQDKNHKVAKERKLEKRPTAMDRFVNKYGYM